MGQVKKGASRNKELLKDFKQKDNAPKMEEYELDREAMEKRRIEKEDPNEILEGDIMLGDLRIREDGRPVLFPEYLWEKVAATQKPLVQIRWKKFPMERLKKIIEQISKMQTDPGRPILGNYLLAQSYANVDVYFNIDENFPAAIKDAVFSILTTDERPVAPGKQRPMANTQYEKAFLEAKCRALERKGMIRESTSEWCAGVILVPYNERIKESIRKWGLEDSKRAMEDPANEEEIGTWFRLTIDYRALNAKTIKDLQPIGRVDEEINYCAGKRFFTTSDVMDAFWAIVTDPKTRHKTAFLGSNKMYEWVRMPQGASNSGPMFSRVMRKGLEGVPKERIGSFVDDISIHSKTFLEHFASLQLVYDINRDTNTKLKASKTFQGYSEVRKLGHLVSYQGRRIDPARVTAILEMAEPRNMVELDSFLGMFPYNQEYLPNIYNVLKPLYSFKGKDSNFDWTGEHTKAFREAKLILSNVDLIGIPDTLKKFYIFVDACTTNGRGMGAVLKQRNDKNQLQPVAYWSKAFTDAERKCYSPTQAEARALHDSIMHWSQYLRHGEAFEVHSDHKALIYMLNTTVSTANRVVMRYILDLQGFNFSLHYIAGKLNIEADAVSRLLRFEDESIFYPKSEDEIRDDKGPVELILSKSETELGKKMINDFLFNYPEVAWRDEFGNPVKVETVKEMIQITEEDVRRPTPKKQRGRPRRQPESEAIVNKDQTFIPLETEIWPEAIEDQLVRDIVSSKMEEMVKQVQQQEMVINSQTCWIGIQERIDDVYVAASSSKVKLKRNQSRHYKRREEAKNKVQHDSDSDDDTKTRKRPSRLNARKMRQAILAKEDPQAKDWQWLVGRIFEDNENHRLYEVIHIFFDRREQKACGYRRVLDDDPADLEDIHPIYCEGEENLEGMVREFERIHGPKGQEVKWPSNTLEFIELQESDPELIKIIKSLNVLNAEDRIDSIIQEEGKTKKVGQFVYVSDMHGVFLKEEKRAIFGKYIYKMRKGILEAAGYWEGGKDYIKKGEETDDSKFRPVVPDLLQPLVLKLYHEGLAHPGRNRTLETILLNYVWPGISGDVKRHISRCRYCSKKKVHTHQPRTPIQKFPIPPWPFYRCHIDLTGPFPETNAGNKYILVLKCALTKWIVLFAIADTKAETIAEFLFDEIICRYGSMEELVSDRGHEFVNNILIELTKLLKIKKLTTTPYHPRGNGMIESFMKTLKDQLFALVDQGHKDWDVYLPVVGHMYRTTVHGATGFTPFYALFGREAKAVSESWVEEFAQTKGITDYVTTVVQALQQTWAHVGDKMERNQERLNQIPKEPREFKEVKIGQRVFLKIIPKRLYKYHLNKTEYSLSSKLAFRNAGPYVVTEKLSPVVYRIQMENKQKTVSIMNLKPMTEPSPKRR